VGEVAPKLLYLERTGADLRPSHPLDAPASAVLGAVNALGVMITHNGAALSQRALSNDPGTLGYPPQPFAWRSLAHC
jgi:hypothetical protein